MAHSSEQLEQEGDYQALAGTSRSLRAILWRRKGLVFFGGVLGVVCAALFYGQRPPVYQSVAQVMMIKKPGNLLSTGAGGDPRTGYYEDYLPSFQILIKSPVVVEKAIRKYQLNTLKSFQGDPNPMDAVLGSLFTIRDTEPTGATSSIIRLAVRCGVPEDCPAVLNGVIDSYKAYLDEKYQKVSRETLGNITKATDALQRDLAKKNKEYSDFRKKYPQIPWRGTEGGAVQETYIASLQTKRLNLLIAHADLQRRVEVIENAVKDGRGRAVLLAQLNAAMAGKAPHGSPERRLDDQLFELMLKENLLLADYGPDHPEVISVRRRMDKTREFFNQGGDKRGGEEDGPTDPVQWHLLTLRQERDDASSSLQAVTTLLENEQKLEREYATYKIEDARYQKEVAGSQVLLESIKNNLEQIKLIQDLGGYDADVIAPAGVGFKTGTGMYQIFVVGMILGLLGGSMLGYLAEMLDKSYHNPDEIRRWLGVPVIGHIPLLVPDKATLKQAAAEDPSLDPHMCTYYQPKSIRAESFRGVRTALYFSTQGEVHKVIQVTSPNKSDGKSTLAANLAICIAQSGKRVVLVDADLRKPRVHKIFGIPASTTGLTKVLTGEVELKEAIVPSRVPGLSLLPCGSRPSNPAELLTSPRFKEFVEAIREDFDFVLIDTPPVLAVSDPSVVAPRVDGVLLAMRISKNVRPSAERAREILTSLGANILGVVVNGVERNSNTYGESYGYGYGYQYSYGYGGYSSPRDRDSYYTEDKTDGKTDGKTDNPAESKPERPAPRERHHGPREQRGFLATFFPWWGQK